MMFAQGQGDLGPPAEGLASAAESFGNGTAALALELLNSYVPIFLAAFLVTLLATPIIRRIAVAADVVDHPDLTRKSHGYAVAYLGGVAVFLGLFVAIAISFFWFDEFTVWYPTVPMAVVIGMVAITFTGLGDDVWGWDPRLKITGQLVAAAGLAISDVGVRVAEGLLKWIVVHWWGHGGSDVVLFSMGEFDFLAGHLYYWAGTALIAIFVLGGCNAANFLDGLDGLLAGVVAVVAVGLLAICLLMTPGDNEAQATTQDLARQMQPQAEVLRAEMDEILPPDLLDNPDWVRGDRFTAAGIAMLKQRLPHLDLSGVERDGSVNGVIGLVMVNPIVERIERAIAADDDLDMPPGWSLTYDPESRRVVTVGRSLTGARIVLCLALLGAVLGFLPYNFNPATIFLGDCGSLLLGYMCIVIILMLGDRGQTHLVLAGLIVFSVPIMDTMLAIIRRRLAGVPVSVGDDLHIHHQLLRTLGGVKRSVFAVYGISVLFALLGVSLAALVLLELLRVRFIYAIAMVLFSFIGVVAVKSARRHQRANGTAAGSKTMRKQAPVAATSRPAKDQPELASEGENRETSQGPSGDPSG